MNLKRYHKDIFFEVGVEDEIHSIIANFNLQATKHFMQSWVKRGNVCIPTKAIIESGEIFEYYRNPDNGKIDHFVIRCKNVSKSFDVIYVINDIGKIMTSWVNNKNDNHKDLKRELYEDGTDDSHICRRKRISKCELLIRKWKKNRRG